MGGVNPPAPVATQRALLEALRDGGIHRMVRPMACNERRVATPARVIRLVAGVGRVARDW